MNPFVNFNTRDVTLPSGCKDLIELQKLAACQSPEPHSTPAITLRDLDHYIAVWQYSSVEAASLWIADGSDAVVALFRDAKLSHPRIQLTFEVWYESQVRPFVEEWLIPPLDQQSVSFAGGAYRTISGSLRNSDDVSAAIRRLFTEGFGRSQDVRLRFVYNEMAD